MTHITIGIGDLRKRASWSVDLRPLPPAPAHPNPATLAPNFQRAIEWACDGEGSPGHAMALHPIPMHDINDRGRGDEPYEVALDWRRGGWVAESASPWQRVVLFACPTARELAEAPPAHARELARAVKETHGIFRSQKPIDFVNYHFDALDGQVRGICRRLSRSAR